MLHLALRCNFHLPPLPHIRGNVRGTQSELWSGFTAAAFRTSSSRCFLPGAAEEAALNSFRGRLCSLIAGEEHFHGSSSMVMWGFVRDDMVSVYSQRKRTAESLCIDLCRCLLISSMSNQALLTKAVGVQLNNRSPLDFLFLIPSSALLRRPDSLTLIIRWYTCHDRGKTQLHKPCWAPFFSRPLLHPQPPSQPPSTMSGFVIFVFLPHQGPAISEVLWVCGGNTSFDLFC